MQIGQFSVVRVIIAIVFFTSTCPAFASVSGLSWDQELDSSTLQKLQTKTGLRIFWWNVHDGQAVLGASDASFNNNIDQLIHSELAPDILAVAEFQNSDLKPDVLAEMNRLYPNHVLQPYTTSSPYGIAVYSKSPFEVKSMDLLDFSPLGDLSAADRETYRKSWCASPGMCDRPLMILDLKIKGKDFKLVPVHLYDCWRLMAQNVGKVETLKQILHGTDNPLWYQILRFRAALEARLGAELLKGNVVMVGDFNMPKVILGFKTLGFGKISSGLVDELAENEPTFPSADSIEASSFLPMQIDHGFVSAPLFSNENMGEVLQLKGSDHYPFYLILQ